MAVRRKEMNSIGIMSMKDRGDLTVGIIEEVMEKTLLSQLSGGVSV